MKNFIALLTLVLCFSVHAADDNYTVGGIDLLVLKKIALAKGLDTFKKELAEHMFVKEGVLERIPPIYYSRPNPYVVEQVINENDQSELSSAAFDCIYTQFVDEKVVGFVGNRLNKERQVVDSNTSARIDYCTTAATTDGSYLGSANLVRVRTELYHKKSALNALNTL